MNILHFRYAVEVARAGSINKASEVLLVAQPNLSRSIRDLETELGITIFGRSSKGMYLTPEGEEFIGYASAVLRQMDEIERLYKQKIPGTQKFSISVPRASYISDAFVRFSKEIGPEAAEFVYRETNAARAMDNILQADYRLGIIRYAADYDRHFKRRLEEKELSCELIAEFPYVLLMNKQSPLAAQEAPSFGDLLPLIEIAHADPFVPTLPAAFVRKEEMTQSVQRRIFVFERGSQLELLAENPETFMWVSPVPRKTLDRFGLTQRPCRDHKRIYRDMLIRKKDYALTELDKRFLTALTESRRACF